MSILVGRETRLVVQGITGREGAFHAGASQAYGTNVVAGVTPGKGGQTALDGSVPVFDTVAESVRQTGANTSLIFVPAAGAPDAVMEAAESLLEAGFAPAHDLYFSFGNNEETAGASAAAAAELLAGRGVRPWLVLDEGGAVAGGAFPGVTRPAAVVGVAEKGILDVELLTRDAGGHASTPPRMGATARLARAITRIESHPFPQSLPDVTVEMLRRFGPHAPAPLRAVFARLSLFRGPVTLLFGRMGNETNAITRTTVAITTLEGSAGANVLAATARANANIRVAVGETVDGTVERLRRIIRDPKVELRVVEGNDPSPVSPHSGAQWDLLEGCIAGVFPEALVTPYIMMGGTDSRRFTGICAAVYRFAPFSMDAEARASIHAVDEKIALETLERGVSFYETLIREL